MTNEELHHYLMITTAAQSMIQAAILRALMDEGAVSESRLSEILDAVESTALQRKTPETPAVTGLIALLRRDLGWPEDTGRAPQ